jgi:Type VI secretion system (T6SS), amidase effector protein 4
MQIARRLRCERYVSVSLNGKKATVVATQLASWLDMQPFCGLPKKSISIIGQDWQAKINGKKGIIYFENYWKRAGETKTATGDHIDLWDGGALTPNRPLYSVTTSRSCSIAAAWGCGAILPPLTLILVMCLARWLAALCCCITSSVHCTSLKLSQRVLACLGLRMLITLASYGLVFISRIHGSFGSIWHSASTHSGHAGILLVRMASQRNRL